MVFEENVLSRQTPPRRIAAAAGLLAAGLVFGGCTDTAESSAPSLTTPSGPSEQTGACEPVVVGRANLDAAEQQAILEGQVPAEIDGLDSRPIFALRALLHGSASDAEITQADQVIFNVLESLPLADAVQTQRILYEQKTDDTLELITFGVPEGCQTPVPTIEVSPEPTTAPA